MTRLFIICIFLIALFSCESDDNPRRNEFLPNKQISFSLRLNLPEYGDLNFSGNDEFIFDSVNFIEGIYIKNNGPSGFTVFELAEPNHPVGNCTLPTEIMGLDFVYKCGNTETKYDLNGIKRGGNSSDFTMRRYRAERSGNILFISN